MKSVISQLLRMSFGIIFEKQKNKKTKKEQNVFTCQLQGLDDQSVLNKRPNKET